MIDSPKKETSPESNTAVKYPKVTRVNFVDNIILNVFLEEHVLDSRIFKGETREEDCDRYLKETYNI